MTIYTRMGSPVQFTSARIVKVWTTVGNIGNGVECKWHYTEPKRTSRWRKDVRVETMHVWHVKAKYLPDGELMFGGDEIDLNAFVADGAIQEIIAECYRINPTDAKWEKETFGEAATGAALPCAQTKARKCRNAIVRMQVCNPSARSR